MKRMIFCILTLVSVISLMCGTVSNKLIKDPDFDSNGNNVGIKYVETDDTICTICLDIYSKPGYWVRVSGNTILKGLVSGREYKLKNTEGLNIGEKFVIGDSSYVNAKLIFEPLMPEDTIIDLIEKDGWQLSGIKLYEESPKKNLTHIEGEIDGHPDWSWLYLCEAGKDLRVNKSRIIPVRGGKFSYDLSTDDDLMYELTIGKEYFEGSWRPISFSAADSMVSIKIPEDEDGDIVTVGGKFTNEYDDYLNKKRDFMHKVIDESQEAKQYEEMFKTGEAYIPEFREIVSQMQDTTLNLSQSVRDSLMNEMRQIQEKGDIMTPELRQLEKSYRDLISQSEIEYIRQAIPSHPFAALFRIYMSTKYNTGDIDAYYDLFRTYYGDIFTEHPYHKALTESYMMAAPVPGNKYIDVSAPDLSGNMVKISDIIGGKVSVINLWASWCGPCRKHGKAIALLYDKYRDKGFEVIGIARERDNADDMVKAIEKDGYKWVNLLELNDQNHIWTKYRAGNGGGKVVLVDKDGTILAIDPTAEEIEKFLIEKLL